MGTFGLILGIIGLVGGIICPFAFPLIGMGELIFVVLAILGIIFSAIGMKRRRRKGHGAATAGLVLSIIAVVLSLIFTFACTAGKAVTDVVTDELSTLDQAQVESVVNEVLEEVSAQEATEAATEAVTQAPAQAEEDVTAQAPEEDVTAAPAEDETEAPEQEEDGEDAQAQADAAQANVAGSDLTADIIIAYGDLDSIVDLGKQAQNFAVAEGTVAQISGVFSTGISTPSIQEPDGNGGYKGINMYVDGDWDKPADHTDIDVIGTFVRGTFNMEFHVSPENITVK